AGDDPVERGAAAPDRIGRAAAAADQVDVIVVKLGADLVVEREVVAGSMGAGIDVEDLVDEAGISVLHHPGRVEPAAPDHPAAAERGRTGGARVAGPVIRDAPEDLPLSLVLDRVGARSARRVGVERIRLGRGAWNPGGVRAIDAGA